MGDETKVAEQQPMKLPYNMQNLRGAGVLPEDPKVRSSVYNELIISTKFWYDVVTTLRSTPAATIAPLTHANVANNAQQGEEFQRKLFSLYATVPIAHPSASTTTGVALHPDALSKVLTELGANCTGRMALCLIRKATGGQTHIDEKQFHRLMTAVNTTISRTIIAQRLKSRNFAAMEEDEDEELTPDDDENLDDDDRRAKECLTFFVKGFDLNNDGKFDKREAAIFTAFNKAKETPDEAYEQCEETIQALVGKTMEEYMKECIVPKPFPTDALELAKTFTAKWRDWQLPNGAEEQEIPEKKGSEKNPSVSRKKHHYHDDGGNSVTSIASTKLSNAYNPHTLKSLARMDEQRHVAQYLDSVLVLNGGGENEGNLSTNSPGRSVSGGCPPKLSQGSASPYNTEVSPEGNVATVPSSPPRSSTNKYSSAGRRHGGGTNMTSLSSTSSLSLHGHDQELGKRDSQLQSSSMVSEDPSSPSRRSLKFRNALVTYERRSQ